MLKTMDTIIETNANKVLALKKAQTCHVKSETEKRKREIQTCSWCKKSGRQP